MPIACLISLSRRNHSTSRGEYEPAANCTTTSTPERTNPVKAIMPVAVAVSRSRAVSTFAVPPSRRPSTWGATMPRRIAPTT